MSAVAVPERNLVMIRSVILARVLARYFGFTAKAKTQVPEIVWRGNEECVKGYLRALFQSDGTVTSPAMTHYLLGSACLEPAVPAEGRADAARELRHLLPRLEASCGGSAGLPDGKGGKKLYDCKADYELDRRMASRAIDSWQRSVS